MRRTGLAFRLLLSLLLVLNGIGSAVAGVRMAMPAMTAVAVQEAAADASMPPCHQAAMADATPARPMPPAGDHRQGDGDCCTSGACDAAGCPCPCTALAVALWPMPPVLAPLALALPPAIARIAPHPSPPRHQPDRPPIA